jgi:hypothetical protein
LLRELTEGNATGAMLLMRLGVLAEKLAALLEDLRSVGTPAAELQPLETLLADLRTMLAVPSADEAEAARLREEAQQKLQEFANAGGSGVAVPAPRQAFWK